MLEFHCTCYKCNPNWPAMRCCAECGNKRCPKGTYCAADCTNSNAPGQKGSQYGPYEDYPDFLKQRMDERLKFINERSSKE